MEPAKRVKVDNDVPTDALRDIASSADSTNQAVICRAPLRRSDAGQRGLLVLPLAAVLEIVSRLHPRDLYNLTRSCKMFHTFFLSQTQQRMWDAAMRNAPGIPKEPLLFLSAPAYVHLLYSSSCHFCGYPSVWWISGSSLMRICRKCVHNATVWYVQAAEEVRLIDSELSDIIFRHEYVSVYFHLLKGSWADQVDENKNRILRTELDRLIRQYKALGDTITEESRKAFVEEVMKERAQRKRCAAQIERWFEQERVAELEARTKQRVSDILARLRQNGWEKELAFMGEEGLQTITQHPCICRPKRLTDAGECCWRKVMKALRRLLYEARAKRLDAELRSVLRQRFDVIEELLQAHYVDIPRTPRMECRPTAIDFALIPECRALLEAPTSEVAPVAAFAAIVPSLADRWESDVREQLSRHMRQYFPKVPAKVDVLELAAAVFTIKSGVPYVLDPRAYALRYPAILRHGSFRLSTNTKQIIPSARKDAYMRAIMTLNFPDQAFPWKRRQGEVQAAGQVPFDSSILEVGRRGAVNVELMCQILRALGLDPARTTIDELSRCEARLRCGFCDPVDPGTDLERPCRSYDWIAAFEHTRAHCGLASLHVDLFETMWRRVDRPAWVIRAFESQQNPLAGADTEWCCALCPSFSGTGEAMKVHLAKWHHIDNARKAVEDRTVYHHPWKGHYHGRCLDIPPDQVAGSDVESDPSDSGSSSDSSEYESDVAD
ncbi:hypothetical protein BV20DRAFT_1054689 [Pilatotrama ljubarskyi]|nr:hypothetical protein BV20DRAFT_1054689 [Pilatotrama ljubarskyi]